MSRSWLLYLDDLIQSAEKIGRLLTGHAAGDRLLQSAASLLRSMLRDADLVARWGGEEFIVLLPDTKRDGAVAVSEKIRAAFERGEKVTASFGVAEHGPNLSREATIAAADEALYRAKREGRNQVMSSA